MALDDVTGGYWLVEADGSAFPFDAPSHSSLAGPSYNWPTREIVPTPDGGGYWTVSYDGGVFSYGNAQFHGSMAGRPFNGAIVGMAPDRATGGYWLMGSDGGVFAFDAPFLGAA
jgi:hypothetical protein